MIDKIIPINGKNSQLDYELFSKSVEGSLGKRCKEFKIFIFNKFPVTLTSGSTFDLVILVIVKDEKGNYYRLSNGAYIHNLIIPVKFINEFYDEKLLVENGEIFDKSTVLDNKEFTQNSCAAFREYLKNKCGLEDGKLNLFPIVLIKQKDRSEYLKNHILAERLTFDLILKYLGSSKLDFFNSYFPWKSNYELSAVQIKRIVDQASLDSEYGYLTQKKLERITKNIVRESNLSPYIGKNLVLIEGKAGSGKSSELVQLMIRSLKSDKNTLYLTYNKLLVYDIAKLVKSFANNYNDTDKPLREYSVKTIHSFFFKICRDNNLLKVLSEKRINEVIDELKIKMRKIFDFLSNFSITEAEDYKIIMEEIQLSSLAIEIKEFGINFVKYAYSICSKKDKLPSLRDLSISYFKKAENALKEVTSNEIFLTDYYNVLENLKLLLDNSDQFYDDYNIGAKVSLFETEKEVLNEKYIETEDNKTIFTKAGFKEYNNRRFGGHKRNRLIFVDEGQDCADIERDILFRIFGTNNIVIASGGVEQLIRHKKLCNWTVSDKGKVPFKGSVKKTKSFRMKKSVSDLCNFIAEYFDLPYKITCEESDDEGEVVIDFRRQAVDNFRPILRQKFELFNVLGFTYYEGCMILLDSSSLRNDSSDDEVIDSSESKGKSEKIFINEYNNIGYSRSKTRRDWRMISELETYDYMFWDGTQRNKDQLLLPSPNEIRTLYYESCRGLEAWSVFCFDIDVFFNVKCNEDDADKFMLDDIFTNAESRKRKFAANWILMAMTRAMDTLYLQVNDINSELGQALNKYSDQNKEIRCFK